MFRGPIFLESRMAKKRKLSAVDDFGFDEDLDFASDWNASAPKAKKKDDRKPATQAAMDFGKGAVSGVWDSARSSSFIKKTVKSALPTGYGTALDMADQTNASLRTLYNSSVKEVRPLLNDMKRATNKLLPTTEKFLPKKVQQRLKSWSESADNGSTGISEEASRHAALQSTLGDIFKFQAETNAQQRAEDKAESDIQKNIDNNRSNNQLGQLNSMRIALQRLADYQDRVTVNFQRKSLEIQYRHYFVAMDSLAEQKAQGARNRELLENIQKNTALPDVLKIKMREDWPTLARNKFFGNVGGMVLGQRSAFMRNLTDRIQKQLTASLSSFAGSAQMALGAADMAADASDMLGEGGPSKSQMAGEFSGGMVADSLGAKAGRWVGKKLKGTRLGDKIDKYGNKAQYYAGNAPQHLTEWAHSDHGDNVPLVGGGIRWLKDQIRASNGVETGMHVDNLRNLQDPAPFNGLARKSLTEVIPGYLARIYRELQILRTGDAKTELTTYDYTRNSFHSKSEMAKNAFGSLVRKEDKAWVHEKGKNLVDHLEKESGVQLTKKQRKALLRRMMQDNLTNRTGSAKRYSDVFSYGGDNAEHAGTFAKLFENYFKDDHDGGKQMRFQARFADLGSGMGDPRAAIQDMISSGMLDVVMQTGLVKNGRLDLDKLMDYYLHDTFNPAASYAGGNVRPMGGGSSHGIHASMASRHRGAKRVKGQGPRKKPRRAFTPTARHRPSAQTLGAMNWNAARRHEPDGFDEWLRALDEADDPAETTPEHHLNIGGRKSAETGVKDCCDQKPIIEAIKESSSKSISEKIHETLLAIQKKVEEGIDVRHRRSGVGTHMGDADGGGVRRSKNLLTWTVGDFGSAAAGAGKWGLDKVKGGFQGAWDWWKRPSPMFHKVKGWGKSGLDAVSGGGKKALSYAKSFDDIYLPGSKEPALLAWKMRAGHYRDKATGNIIKSYKDITSDVEDIFDNDNIVLEAKDIGRAYSKSKIGVKAISALGAAWKGLRGAYDSIAGGVFRLVPKVIEHGIKLAEKGMDLLDQPVDIYVKGKDDPVMLAIMMRGGAYRSQLKGTLITRPSLIDGPVEDISDKNNIKLVLTKEDLAKGLVDRNGKPMKTPLAKLLDLARKPFAMAGRALSKGFEMAKTFVSAPFKALGNWFENWLGKDGIIFAGSRTMIDRLTEIRDILTERLPRPKKRLLGDDGEGFVKGSWEEKEHEKKLPAGDGKAGETGMGAALSKIKDAIKGLTDRFKKKDEEESEEAGEATAGKGFIRKAISKIAPGLSRAGNMLGGMASSLGLNRVAKFLSGSSLPPELAKDGRIAGMYAAMKAAIQDSESDSIGGGGGMFNKAKRLLKRIPGAGRVGRMLGGAKNVLRSGMGRLLGRGALSAGLEGAATVGAEGAAAATGLGAAEAGLGAAALTGAEGAGLLAGATGGSALVAGGATVLSGIATGAGMLGAALLSPVGLGIAGAALLGYSLYKGYKALTKKRLGSLSALRFAQYGFTKEQEKSYLQAVFGLEDKLIKGVVFQNGQASIDAKAVPELQKPKELAEGFDLDLKDNQQCANFAQWFRGRFCPVFLKHMTALQTANANAKLGEVDEKLKSDEKKKYFEASKWPQGPYYVSASPFWDQPSLQAGPEYVQKITQEVAAEIDKDAGKKDGDKGTAGVVASAAAAGALAGKTADDVKPKEAGQDKAKALVAQALGIGTAKPSETGVGGKSTASYAIDPALAKPGQTPGKVETLTGVRYRTYGLKDLDADKCALLRALEAETFKSVRVTNDAAQFNGDPAQLQEKFGAQFGVVGHHNNQAYTWNAWFNMRFLPTYLNYLGTMSRLSGGPTMVGKLTGRSEDMLEPVLAAQIAKAIVGTRTPDSKSVREVTQSPWPGYAMNTDQKSVQAALDFLDGKSKDKAKTLNDGTGVSKDKPKADSKKSDEKKEGDGGKGWTNYLADKAGEGWKSVKDWASNAFNSAKNVVSNVASSIGNAAGKAYDAFKNTKVGGAIVSGVKSAGNWVEKKYSASAQAIKNALLKAMVAAGITKPEEQAMLMAQCDHESGGFKSLTENLHYSAGNLMKVFGPKHFPTMQAAQEAVAGGERAIADAAYGGRLGNSDADDGYKYRGRGVIQLTGKANYAHFGKKIGVDLINNPDLASEPNTAAKLAIAFWQENVKAAGKNGDVRTATLGVNGGLNGLNDRQSKYQFYLKQAQDGKLVPTDIAGKTDAKSDGTSAAQTSAAGGSAPASGSGSTPPAAPASDTSSGSTGGSAPSTASTASASSGSATSSAPAASTGSSPADSPFGFGGSSAKPVGSGSRNIAAVQQAQHDEHMDALGGVGDTLGKSLKVHEESLGTLKAILALMQTTSKSNDQGATSAPSTTAPGTGPIQSGPPQKMPTPPVSMRKMV
ncbi:glycoside hydrolase family protein [Caballeronia arationis]|nr:glycoside hydrolase family protein [Caballeronia arationis]